MGQQTLVVFGADEARVAVLLEQQVVDVLGRRVEGEAARMLHLALHRLHGAAVDVDLARRPRRQKLAAPTQTRTPVLAVAPTHRAILGRSQFISLTPNLSSFPVF